MRGDDPHTFIALSQADEFGQLSEFNDPAFNDHDQSEP